MAEAERYASHQLLRFPNEASHRSSLIPVHTGPQGVFAGVRPKVLAT
jgi:hypothetical protein